VYLFFDTETTGIPRSHDAPASNVANWPRIVQIAWAIADEGGQELRAQSFIVRPDGFEIPPDETRIHGIATDAARRSGVELRQALTAFGNDLAAARFLVAHNIQFDERVVGAEFFRIGHTASSLDAKVRYCTMRSSTDFCQIAGGPRGYKWPTLAQLHQRLFSTGFEKAHDAGADLRACLRCFFELKRMGILPGTGTDTDNEKLEPSAEDQELFDELYGFAEQCPWFDTGRFVDDVYSQFQDRGFISDKQRNALVRVRDMLEEKAG
jgi:DNA polymerase III subunit epsilon